MVERTDTSKRHTPGPWIVIPSGHGHPTEYLCVQYGADERYTSLEMLPLDAHLTAAAPDLLALARQYASECADCGGSAEIQVSEHEAEPCESCAEIWAVINKAEGRA